MPAGPLPDRGRLEVEEDGPALVVRIANEARANALDEAMLDGLVTLLRGPRPARSRVVLLTGAGERHFSAGLDLGDREAEALVAHLQDGARRMGIAAAAIAGCAVPVVGVVNGAAFGGALELLIACDWRIARRGALLGMPAARLGLVYAHDGLRRFVTALGPARTRRLFLTGTPVDADEALALGLVDQVVEPDALPGAARAAAEGVAAAAPLAVAGTRAVVRALAEGPAAADAVREAQAWVARSIASEDVREGLRAYRERRPPRFTGG